MDNILLIYKAGASAPLLLLHQLFQNSVIEFLVVKYCSCVCQWNRKLVSFTVRDKLLLYPTDKVMFSMVR